MQPSGVMMAAHLSRTWQRPCFRVWRRPCSSSSSYFQVLSTSETAGSQSLFLSVDGAKFVFNCGEGCQRWLGLRRSSLLKDLKHVFVTYNSWSNLGGITGLFMSLQLFDFKGPIQYHGPKGFVDFYSISQVFNQKLTMPILENGDEVVVEGPVSIRKVTLHSTRKNVLSPEPMYRSWLTSSFKDMKTVSDEKVDMPKVKKVIRSKRHSCLEDVSARAYIVGHAGRTFIVLECPTTHHLSSLISSQSLRCGSPYLQNLHCIFHFSPHDIVTHQDYKAWMESFAAVPVRHIVINEQCLSLQRAPFVSYNLQLKILSPDLFQAKVASEEQSDCGLHYPLGKEDFSPTVVMGRSGFKVELDDPNHVLYYPSRLKPLRWSDVMSELSGIKGFPGMYLDIKNRISEAKNAMLSLPAEPEYPKITFLGTGSGTSTIYKTNSCILVETVRDHFIMLDCGENSVIQMQLHFGRERMLDILTKLTLIFISHMHIDHHMGFVGIVKMREHAFRQLGQEPSCLMLCAPDWFARVYTWYHYNLEPVLTHCSQIKNEVLEVPLFSLKQNVLPRTKQMLERSGLSSLVTCSAIHYSSAFSTVITTKCGYKLVYSGDTRPNDKLIRLAQVDGAPDLLIHEATLEHYLRQSCINYQHSTFTEAINVGKEMNAKYIMLTHFSQRYSITPSLEEVEGPSCDNVGMAFDLMTISPSTLPLVRLMFPGLKVVYKSTVSRLSLQKTLSHSSSLEQSSVAVK